MKKLFCFFQSLDDDLSLRPRSSSLSLLDSKAVKSLNSSEKAKNGGDALIDAQFKQLRERQKLTDQLLSSREDLFHGITRADSIRTARSHDDEENGGGKLLSHGVL